MSICACRCACLFSRAASLRCTGDSVDTSNQNTVSTVCCCSSVWATDSVTPSMILTCGVNKEKRCSFTFAVISKHKKTAIRLLSSEASSQLNERAKGFSAIWGTHPLFKMEKWKMYFPAAEIICQVSCVTWHLKVIRHQSRKAESFAVLFSHCTLASRCIITCYPVAHCVQHKSLCLAHTRKAN